MPRHVDRVFFHGSSQWLPIGTVLRPNRRYAQHWGSTGFYPVLERHRPLAYLGHARTVFMCDSDADLDSAGGGTDWVFTVRPLGLVAKHDMQWGSLICCAISEGAKASELRPLALNYWTGVASDDPLWEFLTPYAKVLSVDQF